MSMGPDGGCGVPVDGWGVVVAGGGEGEGERYCFSIKMVDKMC